MTWVRVNVSMFLFLVLIGTISCVFAAKNKYYDYERSVHITGLGKFSVGLESDSKLSQERGENIEIFGTPYRFNVQYSADGKAVLKGEISNIEIRSLETGEIVFRKGVSMDTYRASQNLKHHASKLKRAMGFEGASLNIPYHDYRVSFDFRIYKEEGVVFEEGQVKVVLKRHYYEGHVRKGAGII